MTVEVTIVALAGTGLRTLASASLPELPGPIQLRARAMTDETARCQFILSHRAIVHLAQRRNGGRAVSIGHSSAGQPRLSGGPHLSVSRTSGYAAVAFCHAHDVGVDIASTSADFDWMRAACYPGLAGRFRPPGRRGKIEVLRAWTELEAIAKLWQTPMQSLLDRHLPFPTALVSLSGGGLLLTLATAIAAQVDIAFARWTGDGTLTSTPILQTLSSLDYGEMENFADHLL